MTCAETEARLDDYEDGLLSEAELQEVELHLSGCSSCRAEAERLHALVLRAAAAPKQMRPLSDLWPGIKERILLEGSREDERQRSRPWITPTLAAAAAVLIALVSIFVRRPPDTGEGVLQGHVKTAAAGGPSDQVREAEADYLRATSQLTDALNARRGSLQPSTQASLDENLRVIDDALKQVRSALEKDPGNPQLARLLASTHQKKLDLLLRLLKISAEI